MKIKLVMLLMLVANMSKAQGVIEKEKSGFFNISIENLMGIIDFDMDEVAKRLHLKLQSSEYRKMDRIISWYQTKTDSVYTSNQPRLEAIENSYWEKVAAIDNRNDFDQVFAVVKEYIEEVKPFSQPIQDLELELGNWVSGFLTDRQYSKWESYLVKQHKKIKPRTPMPMDGPPAEFL